MDEVIEKLANEILEVCGSEDEVSALLDNVLLYIADLVCGDEDWSPEPRDIRQSIKDAKDDELLEPEVEDEELGIEIDEEGFMSLR